MRCYQNSHYELRFWHNELINNGFNKSDINDLYAITKTKPIKFKIDWDKTNQPHFIFHSGSLTIDPFSPPGSFYLSFLLWLYNKTTADDSKGLKVYRIIHYWDQLVAVFDSSEVDINPDVALPHYDFNGFQRRLKLTSSTNKKYQSTKYFYTLSPDRSSKDHQAPNPASRRPVLATHENE